MINRTVTLYPNEIAAILTAGNPTQVGLSGSDSKGRAIATTDQVTDILNGNPRSALTLDTDSVSTASYFKVLLDKRVQANTAILLGLNARDTYPGDVRNNYTLKHHTSDNYGASTAVVPNSEYAGIIGRALAYYSLDGFDDKITIADDPNLDFGKGNGTIIFPSISFPDVSGTTYLMARFASSTNRIEVWYAANVLSIIIRVGGDIMLWRDRAWTPTAGQRYNIAISWINFVSSEIYVDGEALTGGSNNDNSGGDMNIAADLVFGLRDGVYYAFDTEGYIQYNRNLSAAEILAQATNPELYPLVADQYGKTVFVSDFSSTVDGVTGTDLTLAANIDSIGGENDTLRGTLTGGSGGHQFRKDLSADFPTIKNGTFAVRVYIPSTNTKVDGFSLFNGAASVTGYGLTGTGSGAAQDTWIDVVVTGEPIGTSTIRVQALDGTDNIIDQDGDLIYIKDWDINREGAVIVLQPEGMTDATWYDRSTNDLDGTITGADNFSVATGELKDAYVSKFDEIDTAVIYMDNNSDGLTGAADLSTSALIIGKAFVTDHTIRIERGSFSGPDSYPGVKQSETQGGTFLSNVRFGRRNPFKWKYTFLSDADRDILMAMQASQGGPQRLMVIGIREDDGPEKFYPVKIIKFTDKRRGNLWDVSVSFQEQATT